MPEPKAIMVLESTENLKKRILPMHILSIVSMCLSLIFFALYMFNESQSTIILSFALGYIALITFIERKVLILRIEIRNMEV